MTPEALFDSLYRAAPPQLATWMSRHRAGILAMLGQWLTELRAEVQAAPPAKVDVLVVYDPAEGLYLESPREAADTIKSLRDSRQIPYFRWHSGSKRWGVNGSRDKPWDYPLSYLEKIAQHFRDEGFTAAARVTGERRAFAEQVADIEARAADRAERLETAAERAQREASARYQAVRRTGDIIPMGQPILVDHYSAGRHRRDIARMSANMTKSIEAEREARELSAKAAQAEARAGYGTDPAKAATRLATLRKDIAKIETYLATGAYSDDAIPRRQEQLAALKEERAHWLKIAPNIAPVEDAFKEMKNATKTLKKLLGATRLMQGAAGTGARKWAIYSIYGPVTGKERYGDIYAWSGQLYVTPTYVEFSPHATIGSVGKYHVERNDRSAEETMQDLANRMSAEVQAAVR